MLNTAPAAVLSKYLVVPMEMKRAVVTLVFSLRHSWLRTVELHGEVKTLPAGLLSRQRPVKVFLIRKPEPVLI